MNNIKAHLLIGESLCMLYRDKKEPKRIEAAIKRMKKALSLCSSQQKRIFEEKIRKSIFRAKKILYYINKSIEDEDKKEIFKELQKKLKNDKSTKVEEKEEIIKGYKELVMNDIKLSKDKIPTYFICPLSKVFQ